MSDTQAGGRYARGSGGLGSIPKASRNTAIPKSTLASTVANLSTQRRSVCGLKDVTRCTWLVALALVGTLRDTRRERFLALAAAIRVNHGCLSRIPHGHE